MCPRRTVVLASASPRRRELLRCLGLGLDLVSPQVDESTAVSGRHTPENLAEALALAKAEWAVAAGKQGVIIAADTVVAHQGRMLGKPGSEAEGRDMLRSLRGRTHRVTTGLAVIDTVSGARSACHVSAEVKMRLYSDQEIEAYLASGRYADKAGGYGIQDEPFSPVEYVKGCYLNVVGLPLCETARQLARIGVSIDPAAAAKLPGICRRCESRAI